MPKELHCLRQRGTNQLFAYTDEMANRPDMEPYAGPPLSQQPQHKLLSQQTIMEQAAASKAKVQNLLDQAQDGLNAMSAGSAQERNEYMDENAKLRQQLADMQAGKATPAPAASLAPPEGNMQVVETTAPVANADPVASAAAETPESGHKFSTPEGVQNAEVVAHTDTPVLSASTAEPPAHAVVQEQPTPAPAPVVVEQVQQNAPAQNAGAPTPPVVAAVSQADALGLT